MFTYAAHFDRKGGIYIATNLFQFASLKEPYVTLAGPDGFFRPHTGIFLIVLQWQRARGRTGYMMTYIGACILQFIEDITQRKHCDIARQ